MADETRIITQPKGERFALDHNGVSLYGDREQPSIRHTVEGKVAHLTPEPLVHIICWQEEQACRVGVDAHVTLSGDRERPVEVRVQHHFANDHKQTLTVERFEHAMSVPTSYKQPIHHALQMTSPVELRFCNPWQIDSAYQLEVRTARARLLSIRLQGSTRCTPLPCDDQPPSPEVGVPNRPG